MINGEDFYHVLSAVVPLYFAMSLAYASVRWWKIFTPEQCAGISRFVSVFAIPILSFNLIAFTDFYSMNFRFVLADTLQKLVIIIALLLWNNFSKNGSLEWVITLNSLSTLPNTLVVGIPLLGAMYGDFSESLMIQIVVFQGAVWNSLLLFLFEYRAAKLFVNENFPENAGSIASFEAESDVISLAATGEPLNSDAEIDSHGKLHVKVRKSSASSSNIISEWGSMRSVTPRISDLNGVEIYSVRSSLDQSNPRVSSFSLSDFPLQSSLKETRTKAAPNSNKHQQQHMFVWSSSTSSQRNQLKQYGSSYGSSSAVDHGDIVESAASNGYTNDSNRNDEENNRQAEMPPTRVLTKLIFTMVWRKIIRNPNTYASAFGIVWSLVSFRWHITTPLMIRESIKILSNTGMGMAMFSLGQFMALQPSIIPCGALLATFSMAVRFLVGPAVTAATAAAVGLRGALLQVIIVQAALPLAVLPFVFAKEYNVHAQILSTSVTIGIGVALPVTIVYYVLLGL